MEQTADFGARLGRYRLLAMEQLVEQAYRCPENPPKTAGVSIDRASLLAFYRVHNPGLATEAKAEEILSGYRGRTHVLVLMLAKKYGKGLVERLQSTPQSAASTRGSARKKTASRPVLRPISRTSAQRSSKKTKVHAAVAAEEQVPFATSLDEERTAVASARLEARYAAERLHRARARLAEEAVEVERTRAAKLEQDLATALADAVRIKATATGAAINLEAVEVERARATRLAEDLARVKATAAVASNSLGAAATALENAHAEAAAARAETERLEAQLAEAPKCDEDALLAALAKAERDRDAAKDRCAKEEALAASEAKRLSSERRHVTTALEAATTACQEAEATVVAARRERDAARADAEVVRRHASDMAAAREDATAQSAANDAAATVVRAYAAGLEAELVDAAAEVERLTGALLANDAMTDATASMQAEAEALELQLEAANSEVARLAESAAAAAFESEEAAAARDAALLDATDRAARAEREAAARDAALLDATTRASTFELAALAATEEHSRLSDERETFRRERDALAMHRAASEVELSKLKSAAERAQAEATVERLRLKSAAETAQADAEARRTSEAALRSENERLLAAALDRAPQSPAPTLTVGVSQTTPGVSQTTPPRTERSPPRNGPGPRSPPRTARAVARRGSSRRRGRSPTPRGIRSSVPTTELLKRAERQRRSYESERALEVAALRVKLQEEKSAPLVSPSPKQSTHLSPSVVEEEVEAVLPDEAPTTSHFGPRGRVLACFCLALVAVSLRTGRVEAPVVAIPFPTTVDVPPPPFVRPLRRRRFAQFGRLAGRRRNPVSPREERRGLKIGRPGLLVAGGATAKPILGPVVRFFTRRPVLRKIGGFVARAGLSNTAMRGLRKVLRRAIPVLRG